MEIMPANLDNGLSTQTRPFFSSAVKSISKPGSPVEFIEHSTPEEASEEALRMITTSPTDRTELSLDAAPKNYILLLI